MHERLKLGQVIVMYWSETFLCFVTVLTCHRRFKFLILNEEAKFARKLILAADN
jgi:hypothetical protein